MSQFQKLRDLLEKNYNWPALYTFKFIIPNEKEVEFKRIMEIDVVVKSYKVRPSGQGKYLGFTFSISCESTDHVIRIYEKAITIVGVISL